VHIGVLAGHSSEEIPEPAHQGIACLQKDEYASMTVFTAFKMICHSGSSQH
jgi:hypothetical protein